MLLLNAFVFKLYLILYDRKMANFGKLHAHTLTALESRADPLMGLMHDTILGNDYSDANALQAARLDRIDEIVEAMGRHGITPIAPEIDRGLERAALAGYINSVYAPHYPVWCRCEARRNGCNYITVHFTALHYFLKKFGYTVEMSQRFTSPAYEHEKTEAYAYAEGFTHLLWLKHSSGPSAEAMTRYQEPRHVYQGMPGLSDLAADRVRCHSATYGYPTL